MAKGMGGSLVGQAPQDGADGTPGRTTSWGLPPPHAPRTRADARPTGMRFVWALGLVTIVLVENHVETNRIGGQSPAQRRSCADTSPFRDPLMLSEVDRAREAPLAPLPTGHETPALPQVRPLGHGHQQCTQTSGSEGHSRGNKLCDEQHPPFPPSPSFPRERRHHAFRTTQTAVRQQLAASAAAPAPVRRGVGWVLVTLVCPPPPLPTQSRGGVGWPCKAQGRPVGVGRRHRSSAPPAAGPPGGAQPDGRGRWRSGRAACGTQALRCSGSPRTEAQVGGGGSVGGERV